MTDGRATAYSP